MTRRMPPHHRGFGRRSVFAVGFVFLAALFFGLTSNSNSAYAGYASIIVDAQTGEVLHATNANQRSYPASLTKVMTLYLAFDALERKEIRLNDRMRVSEHAENQAPSKLGLRAGQTLSVEDAILALVTKSANDVAVVLGEHLGGTEENFARMMTAKAHALGMSRTTFRNASGLPDPEQQSTARDMATLARATLRNHPRHYHYFSTRTFSFAGQRIGTHNRLMLRYKGADGMKTGYIRASGFNLVTSAQRNGRRLIGVVFGGRTAAERDRHMAQLLDQSFAARPTTRVATRIEDLIEANDPDPSEDADTAITADTEEDSPQKSTIQASAHPVAQPAAQPAGKKLVLHQPEPMGSVASGSIAGTGRAWGIQVGAFNHAARALKAAGDAHKRLASAMPSSRVLVSPLKQAGRTVYRARIMEISENEARNACKRLGTTKTVCQIVAPQGTTRIAQGG